MNPNKNFILLGLLLFALLTNTNSSLNAQDLQSETPLDEKTISEEIQNFNVIIKSGKVFIKWTQLPSETDCMLSIEKSDNGIDFEEIGTKKGVKSDFVLFYSFIDHNPSSSISYYKVKHTNSNGEVSYSAIRQINNQAKKELADTYLSTASLN
ncbi:MAG: hypothetical protein HKN75_10380 [Bacteroidia bacterium]|nr:hypothetical protein [Bacteroidia bacterium]